MHSGCQRSGKAAGAGGRKGFALHRLADDQSELRYQPGWQPQEAAASSDPPCALSSKSWGVAAAQTGQWSP